MANVAALEVAIGADIQGLQRGFSDATRQMQGLHAPIGGLGSAFGGLGSRILSIGPLAAGAMVGIAGALGSVAKFAFDAAIAFDAASDRIRIATGATGAELAKLEGSFRTVFTSVPASAEDASAAIAFLSSRLGTTGKELEGLATIELELARVTGSALVPQLEATTRLFGDWEIATQAQASSLDFLFKVSQKTSIGVTDLSQKLVQFGAPLRQMGFSFEQAAVLIGKFQAEGVELTKVLPGLRIALSNMAKAGVTDAGQAFEYLTQKIKDTKNPLEATKLAMELFGKRAGPDMAEAIRQGRFAIEDLQKTIAGSSDTILKAAGETKDFAESWTLLKNKATEAIEPLGKVVFDMLSDILNTFNTKGASIKEDWDRLWDKMNSESGEKVMRLSGSLLVYLPQLFIVGRKFADSVKAGWDSGGIAGLLRGGGWFGGAAPGRNEQPFNPLIPTPAAAANYTEGIKKATAAITGFGAANKGAGGHARETTKILTEQEKQLKSLKEAMTSIVEGINRTFRDAAIDKILVDKIAPAVDTLKRKLTELRGEFILAIAPAVGFSNALGAIPHVQLAGGINVLAAKLAQLVEEENLAALASQRLHDQMVADFEDMSRRLPDSFNQIIDAILNKSGATGKALLELAVKVKGYFDDVFQVIGNLPGKVGDTLRRVTSEFNRWVNTINGILSLLNRIFNTGISNIGDLVTKVVGIFKSSTPTLQQTAGTFGGTLADAIGDGVKSGQTTIQGAITDTVSGALKGAKSALSKIAGVVGIVGGIIGIVGLIAGLFKGKSAAEKAQEAAALQKAKDEIKLSMQSVLKGAQEVVQSAITSFNMALEFFNRLDEFTGVRKITFTKFFTALTRMMDGFLAMTKKWSGESLAKAKKLAEHMGPIVDTIAKAPLALDAIGKYLGVGDASLIRFFADLDKLVDRFIALASETTTKMERQAKKFADRLGPGVELIGATIAALVGMGDLKPIPEGAFDILKSSLLTFVSKLGDLAEFFDKKLLKAVAFLAEKITPTVDLWKGGVEAINSMADIKAPSPGAFNTLFAGIEAAINGMIDLAGRLSTEGLNRAQAIATASLAIFSAIKAGVEALAQLQTYKDVATDVFGAFLNNFNQAIDMLVQMAQRGLQFESISKTFESYIASGQVSLVHAFEMLKQIVTAAGGFFPGGTPALAGGGDFGSTSFVTTSAVASGGFSSHSAPSVEAGPTVHVHVAGSVIVEAQLEDAVVRGVLRAQKRRGPLSTWR